MDLKKIFAIFFRMGKRILEATNDSNLVERLLIDLRAEQTPGRFLHKLSIRITDYNKKYPELSLSLPSELIQNEIKGDKFFYLKSAIITGLLNSITSSSNS